MHRARMRALVFSDAQARARLEAILHPLIRAAAQVRVDSSPAAYVLLVVPLLVEAGSYRGQVQRVLVVDCDEELQVTRVMRRGGLSEQQARAIIASQATREQRLLRSRRRDHQQRRARRARGAGQAAAYALPGDGREDLARWLCRAGALRVGLFLRRFGQY